MSSVPPATPLETLSFDGKSGEDVTHFLRDVKRVALEQGRQTDEKWILYYTEACLGGPALRWYSGLDEETTCSWKSLREAFLERFVSDAPEPPAAIPPSSVRVFTPQIVPASSAMAPSPVRSRPASEGSQLIAHPKPGGWRKRLAAKERENILGADTATPQTEHASSSRVHWVPPHLRGK